MENVFKNDISEGNKIINTLTNIFKVPLKQKATAQIIFQHTYPTFFKKERLQLVSGVSFYLSCKICENFIKLGTFVEIYYKVFEIKLQKDKFIDLEVKISEMINFNFDIMPVHIIFLRLVKSLKIGIEDRLWVIEKMHEDHRVNYINYFNGMYDPELVALSLLSQDEIRLFEALFFVKVDRQSIQDIRRVLSLK